jgi:uncharacterized protein
MLEHSKYINLRTFKRDLSGVETPVWTVTLTGKSNSLFAFTNRLSGKVKRIKKNSAAQVCSCDFRGKAIGEWVEATVEISEERQIYLQVINACKKKYGWGMHLLEFLSTVFNRRKDRVVVQVILKK